MHLLNFPRSSRCQAHSNGRFACDEGRVGHSEASVDEAGSALGFGPAAFKVGA